MIRIFSVFLSVALLLAAFGASAQKRKLRKPPAKVVSIYDIDTLVQPVPNSRATFHISLNREIRKADASDGSLDGFIYYSDDTAASGLLTRTIIGSSRQLATMVENLPSVTTDRNIDNQMRIGYLRYVINLVRRYNSDNRVDVGYYKRLYANFKEMLVARYENRLPAFVSSNISIYTLDNSELMENFPESRNLIYSEMGKQEPVMMIKRLGEFAREPFACNIIASAARSVPNEIYNYATSSNFTLSNAVKNCRDSLVQTIVEISAQSKSPLKAMPFLSDIYSGRKTVRQIDEITADPELFYKNLVRLKLEKESLGNSSYTDELQFRGLKFVRTLNELHESPEAVRFKVVENFSPVDLYYLMVFGQDEIYTSSYLGCFKRMVERMGRTKGDSLFEAVHYDRFRTFIRMCAGYNTLGTFFNTIDEQAKTKIMTDFVADLERGKENELEDAVDVADAFSSIRDSALTGFLRTEIVKNYERCTKIRSRKGMVVYSLLAALMNGNTAMLDIPPITFVPYKSLVNDKGIVYEQFFFYGDEDGKASYQSFIGAFRESKEGKWKITTDKYWTTLTSTSGKPVVIYANLPIPEPGDEEAQTALVKYLSDSNIHPSMIVHRGHSYHLPLTLDRLTKESKIVMLGSCGGYHNLGVVLDHSPDANIISTKQTGAMAVNEPIIQAINSRLLAGEDVKWIPMWDKLSDYFAKKGGVNTTFSDYVPPHKNLGAIFIKAYRKISSSSDL